MTGTGSVKDETEVGGVVVRLDVNSEETMRVRHRHFRALALPNATRGTSLLAQAGLDDFNDAAAHPPLRSTATDE
jgi:hypothetical protein